MKYLLNLFQDFAGIAILVFIMLYLPIYLIVCFINWQILLPNLQSAEEMKLLRGLIVLFVSISIIVTGVFREEMKLKKLNSH